MSEKPNYHWGMLIPIWTIIGIIAVGMLVVSINYDQLRFNQIKHSVPKNEYVYGNSLSNYTIVPKPHTLTLKRPTIIKIFNETDDKHKAYALANIYLAAIKNPKDYTLYHQAYQHSYVDTNYSKDAVTHTDYTVILTLVRKAK